MKTFSLVGTSVHKGELTLRFANDIGRVKVLSRGNAHTDIKLVDMGRGMTKVNALKFLQKLPEFSDFDTQMLIAEYLHKHDDGASIEQFIEQEVEQEVTA